MEKKGEYHAFVKKHGAEINRLKQKSQLTYGHHVIDILNALGIGKEIPNPADYFPPLNNLLNGMTKAPIPPALAKLVTDYNDYRTGLAKAVGVESANVNMSDPALVKEMVDELMDIGTRTLLMNEAASDFVMNKAPLVLGKEGGKKPDLMEWFLKQTHNTGTSLPVRSELKAFLEPLVIRMIAHQQQREGMEGHESLKKVCTHVSHEIVEQMQKKAYSFPLPAKHVEKFIELVLEDYLYCIAMNLKTDSTHEGGAIELLFGKMGKTVQTFLEAHNKELQNIIASNEEASVKEEKLNLIFRDLSQELKEVLIPQQEMTDQKVALTDYFLPQDLPYRDKIKEK